ncbi:hypothetical protein BKA57DRAFT_536179, partial [Linnemannia elongata]
SSSNTPTLPPFFSNIFSFHPPPFPFPTSSLSYVFIFEFSLYLSTSVSQLSLWTARAPSNTKRRFYL